MGFSPTFRRSAAAAMRIDARSRRNGCGERRLMAAGNGGLAREYLRPGANNWEAWASRGAAPAYEDEADRAALRFSLPAWQDPYAASETATPLWSHMPMLDGELVPGGIIAVVPLLAGAGPRLEGLRLVDGAVLLKVERGDATVQVRIAGAGTVRGDAGLVVRFPLGLALPVAIERARDLWDIAGGHSPRQRRVRGANGSSHGGARIRSAAFPRVVLAPLRPGRRCSSTQRAIPRQVAVSLCLRESPSASNHVVAVVRAVAAAHTWNVRGVVRDANLAFELHARPVAHEASRQTPPRLPERGLPQYLHAPTKVPSSSFEAPATGVSHGESRRVRDRQGGSRLVAVQARAAPFAFSEGFKVPESEPLQHGPAQLSSGWSPASTGDFPRSGFRLIASETGGAGQAAGQLRGVGTVQASRSRRATPLSGLARSAPPRAATLPASLPAVSPLALLAAKPASSQIPRFVPGSGG